MCFSRDGECGAQAVGELQHGHQGNGNGCSGQTDSGSGMHQHDEQQRVERGEQQSEPEVHEQHDKLRGIALHERIERFDYGDSDSEGSLIPNDDEWWQEVECEMANAMLAEDIYERTTTVTYVAPGAHLSTVTLSVSEEAECRRRIRGKRPAPPSEIAARPSKRHNPG